MGQQTKPINVVTSLIFMFCAVTLFGFVVAVIFYFQYAQDQLAATTASASSGDALRQVRTHEDEVLTNYAYVNKDKGIVRIPIEQSMQLEAIESWRMHPQDFPFSNSATTASTTDSAMTGDQATTGSEPVQIPAAAQ